ncbi:MAG: T9SS type A sorting domain-containing protein [Hymenobacter sp.]|nr:MAG: T9SS type A sorting domain-containing protein [Hymenobacter sp.]
MTHSYIAGTGLGKQLRQLGLTALLAGGTALAAQAQFSYSASLVTNVAGTYTDLSTNGTVIATVNNDDANSAAQNIGFNFSYNGTVFTQFVLNTNGLLRLGAAAPSAALAASAYGQMPELAPINSTNSADVNLLMPFNFDLISGTGGAEYRVYTTGAVGSRICTIQWKNVADKVVDDFNSAPVTSLPTQYTNFSFQVKLYEANNQIEFVYNSATAGTSALKYAVVGLKGSSNAAGQDILATKASTGAWSTTTFLTGPQQDAFTVNAHNFRSTALPDAGRTYRFVPNPANDAAVTSVFTLGKLPVPAALPHAVQAVITNAGSSALTNLVATLNVTGANTFSNTQTVASLAVGASTTVTFAAYPTTFVAGTNTVTVTVPTDGNTTNNSVAVQQAVATGTGTFSYVPSDQTNVAGNFVIGAATTGGIFATRYTTQRAGTVTSVSVYLGDAGATTASATSVGKTVYGVVLSPAGVVLGQSANYVIQTSDIGTYKAFAITTPPTVALGGSFLAGLAQPVYTGLRFYPIAIQDESPTRSNTYFSVPVAGGTPTDLSVGTGGANSGFGRFMMEATLSVTLATSKELQRAITLYPNPSESGIINLSVQGANASGALGVEVTNQLGQRVYTGSARDNNTTKLDLSNLAAGIYHLQVRNGEEYTSSKISLTK